VPSEIELLYREYRGRLVRLVERELHDHADAEDVVQTAFLDAQRALERGTIPRNPRAWLSAIALNAAHRLRGRRLNAEPLEDYAVEEASGTSEIRAALANLPREQRAAVLYRDVLGLSYGETADQMGTSVNAVTMLLHRGRRRLRQTLGVAVGGAGLWRWLRQGGTPQVAAVKGAAAVVAAAGLATGGVVAAEHTVRAVAPVRADATVAPLAHSGSRAARARRTARHGRATKSARRPLKTGSAGVGVGSAPPASTEASTGDAAPAFVPSSTVDAVTSTVSPLTLPVPTVSVPSLTVPATVTVSTPVATVTVTTPTVPTATVTTPIVTVTVPIP
jgi:RNA polymerase sigma-70 factor, ECF subfamily